MPVFFGAGRGRLTFVKVLSLANKQVKRSGIVSRSAREPPIMRRTVLPSLYTKKKNRTESVLFCGAGGGIRTPVGFHPNGFQDRLVMTASIFLHCIFLILYYYKRLYKKCQRFLCAIIKKGERKPFLLFNYGMSSSGGTSISSETYFPFFLRWRTHSESKYSICPFTERKSSSAHAAIALYSFGDKRKGTCFFPFSFMISYLPMSFLRF